MRGATQVPVDDRETVLFATRELVTEVLQANGLADTDVVSVVFTATRDISSVAPAMAARQLGLHDVALICAQEMWVENSMPRVVRLLAHIETDRPRGALRNVYLHGTETLRIRRAGRAGPTGDRCTGRARLRHRGRHPCASGRRHGPGGRDRPARHQHRPGAAALGVRVLLADPSPTALQLACDLGAGEVDPGRPPTGR